MLKRLKFIIVCILSLTIIYVGAGVNLSYCHCACKSHAKAEAMNKSHCHELDGKAAGECYCMHKYGIQNGKCSLHGRTNCCKAVIYKVDLQKDAPNTVLNAPVSAVLTSPLLLTCNDLPVNILEVGSYSDPPSPSSSRFYLNLYSTLLI